MDIEFFCDDASVIEHFPVKPANKVVPEWYKDLPPWKKNPIQNFDAPTIKGCMPAQDMMLSGYIIFNTYETVLHPEDDSRYEAFKVSTAMKPYVNSHHHEQCPVHINGKKKHYFKLAQPWIVKTPPGYSCLFVQPFYHFEERYRLLPAIVDTDQHDLSVEIPGYAMTMDNIRIESGAPLVQVIPFKRDDWTMKIQEKPRTRSRLEFMLNAAYRTVFHQKKSFK